MTQPTLDQWHYSGDPSSSVLDEVRFLVQDTDPEFRLLGDVEIAYLITKWMPHYDSLIYVASVAAALIARKFIGVLTISADGVTVSTADLHERYVQLGAELRAEYGAAQGVGGVIDIANLMTDVEYDASLAPLVFGIGIHDNYLAGQQSYGGTIDPWRQSREAVDGS